MQRNGTRPLIADLDALPLPDREMWLDTLLVPIRSETGEVHAALGIARNVAEREQAEGFDPSNPQMAGGRRVLELLGDQPEQQ